MSGRKKNKILIALDGSERAFEGVLYVSRVPCFQKMKVDLLFIFMKVPETYLDLESQPLYAQEVSDVRSWEVQEKADIHDYLEKASRYLTGAGFREGAIQIHIRERKSGVARDIIEKARRGEYAAVIAGRRGASKLDEILLGSIAFKLLERVSFTPLALIGTGVKPGKILIGFDGSEESMRAVRMTADFFCETRSTVLLLDVIRSRDKAVIKRIEERIQPLFEQAKEHLVGKSFDPDKIESKIISNAESRSGTILEEARAGGYGTIIVGRRGVSGVGDFFMGSVCLKVVQLAVEQAVWVMN